GPRGSTSVTRTPWSAVTPRAVRSCAVVSTTRSPSSTESTRNGRCAGAAAVAAVSTRASSARITSLSTRGPPGAFTPRSGQHHDRLCGKIPGRRADAERVGAGSDDPPTDARAPGGEARGVEEHFDPPALPGGEGDLREALELVRRLAGRGREPDVELDDRRPPAASRVAHLDRDRAPSFPAPGDAQVAELEVRVGAAEAK